MPKITVNAKNITPQEGEVVVVLPHGTVAPRDREVLLAAARSVWVDGTGTTTLLVPQEAMTEFLAAKIAG